MFAPNRLLTPKEQWLLLGVALAVLLGSVTLFYQSTRESQADYIPASVQSQPVVPVKTPAPSAPQPVQADEAAPLEEESVAALPESIPAPAAVTPAFVGVAVMGAVAHPGLYTVSSGSRVMDVIEEAGGVLDSADLSNIMLTARVIDETTITIPEQRFGGRDSAHVAVRSKSTRVLNHPDYRKHTVVVPVRAPLGTAPHDREMPSITENVASSTSGRLNINYATSDQLQQLPGIGAVYAARIIEERQRRPFTSVEELSRVSGIGDKRLETLRPLVTAP